METLWARRPDVQGLRLSISPGLSRRSSQDQGLHGHVAVRQHPQMSEVTKCRGEVRANVRRHVACDHSTAAPAQAFGNNSSNHGILFRMPKPFTGFNPLQITSSKQCAEKSTTTCYTSRTTKPFEVDEDSAVPVQAAAAANILDSKSAGWFDAFWRFTRPHTIIGSGLSVTSVSLLAIQNAGDLNLSFAVGLLQAIIPALCMNVYIVGLNQLYDIDIDKMNKPYLPLASGEFSVATGTALVTSFAGLSLAMGVYVGSPPLLWALTVSLILGTAYSIDMAIDAIEGLSPDPIMLKWVAWISGAPYMVHALNYKHPLLRWKRSAVAAASCILAVRAVVVQLGFYLHMQVSVLGREAMFTKPLWFATGFMCFFSIVIALAKDIPDVEGDKVFGIHSFSVRLGQKRVFWTCVALLQAAYAAAIFTGLSSPVLWSKVITCVGHAIMAGILWERSGSVDLKSQSEIASWYMFIWKLFYAEYLFIPFMR